MAEARWDRGQFKDENGKFDPEKIKAKLPNYWTTFTVGQSRKNLSTAFQFIRISGAARYDMKNAKSLLKVSGVQPAEQGAMLKTAELDARKDLTKPEIMIRLKSIPTIGRLDLDRRLAMDPETIGAAIRELKMREGANENSNGDNRNSKLHEEVGEKKAKPEELAKLRVKVRKQDDLPERRETVLEAEPEKKGSEQT